MRARFMKAAVLAPLVLAVPAMALAAAPDKAEKVASKMLGLDKAITTIGNQIDLTLKSMNALTATEGDLVAKYKTFSDNVTKLEKGVSKAKSAAESAKSQREAYLAQWKDTQDKIQNPELKAASESRRAELEPKIEAIKSSLTSARDEFQPFMADLKDLTLFLGNQLNPGGVTAASALFAKCNASGEKVKSDLSSGSAAVRDLAAAIQPGGATK
ncbi:MAG TPA: DUF2959 family protein [Candidatus Polarisedimenticolia bacterium]|nr:DUF2959 family protein [Candidatus Polarisedimenticolia bacterium]